jgi:formiminotetrahydrofolate cyclodeaminase
LGLDSLAQLREFCLELSSGKASPGGGTASAASGAMASSLLVMVCGITSRSKKHASSKPQLDRLSEALREERDVLLDLALEDALAYDRVVDAMKQLKNSQPGEDSAGGLQKALRHAAEIPLETASACLRVLEDSVKVAEIGIRSASSDILVAVLLAGAGLEGAAKNVRINLRDINDAGFAAGLENKLADVLTAAEGLSDEAAAKLDRP